MTLTGVCTWPMRWSRRAIRRATIDGERRDRPARFDDRLYACAFPTAHVCADWLLSALTGVAILTARC